MVLDLNVCIKIKYVMKVLSEPISRNILSEPTRKSVKIHIDDMEHICFIMHFKNILLIYIFLNANI